MEPRFPVEGGSCIAALTPKGDAVQKTAKDSLQGWLGVATEAQALTFAARHVPHRAPRLLGVDTSAGLRITVSRAGPIRPWTHKRLDDVEAMTLDILRSGCRTNDVTWYNIGDVGGTTVCVDWGSATWAWPGEPDKKHHVCHLHDTPWGGRATAAAADAFSCLLMRRTLIGGYFLRGEAAETERRIDMARKSPAASFAVLRRPLKPDAPAGPGPSAYTGTVELPSPPRAPRGEPPAAWVLARFFHGATSARGDAALSFEDAIDIAMLMVRSPDEFDSFRLTSAARKSLQAVTVLARDGVLATWRLLCERPDVTTAAEAEEVLHGSVWDSDTTAWTLQLRAGNTGAKAVGASLPRQLPSAAPRPPRSQDDDVRTAGTDDPAQAESAAASGAGGGRALGGNDTQPVSLARTEPSGTPARAGSLRGALRMAPSTTNTEKSWTAAYQELPATEDRRLVHCLGLGSGTVKNLTTEITDSGKLRSALIKALQKSCSSSFAAASMTSRKTTVVGLADGSTASKEHAAAAVVTFVETVTHETVAMLAAPGSPGTVESQEPFLSASLILRDALGDLPEGEGDELAPSEPEYKKHTRWIALLRAAERVAADRERAAKDDAKEAEKGLKEATDNARKLIGGTKAEFAEATTGMMPEQVCAWLVAELRDLSRLVPSDVGAAPALGGAGLGDLLDAVHAEVQRRTNCVVRGWEYASGKTHRAATLHPTRPFADAICVIRDATGGDSEAAEDATFADWDKAFRAACDEGDAKHEGALRERRCAAALVEEVFLAHPTAAPDAATASAVVASLHRMESFCTAKAAIEIMEAAGSVALGGDFSPPPRSKAQDSAHASERFAVALEALHRRVAEKIAGPALKEEINSSDGLLYVIHASRVSVSQGPARLELVKVGKSMLNKMRPRDRFKEIDSVMPRGSLFSDLRASQKTSDSEVGAFVGCDDLLLAHSRAAAALGVEAYESRVRTWLGMALPKCVWVSLFPC